MVERCAKLAVLTVPIAEDHPHATYANTATFSSMANALESVAADTSESMILIMDLMCVKNAAQTANTVPANTNAKDARMIGF